MANPYGYPSTELRPCHFNETFWFDTTNGGAVQPTSMAPFNPHGVVSINKTGVGSYTLTLGEKYNGCTQANASLECQAGEFGYSTCSKPDVQNTKTFVVQTVNGGGTALTDPAAARRVFVTLTLVAGTAKGN